MTRILSVLVLLAMSFGLSAQPYPAKPVRLIVPYPAGGGTDFFARLVGGKMAEGLGQQVVVENRPGAATMIGAEAAARSPADGYTLLLGDSGTMAVNPHLYAKVPYNIEKDFAPITLTARFALLLVTNPAKEKAGSVKELIAEAKKAPGKIDFASVGPGSAHHLAMEAFMQQAGIRMNHIPYKGAAPAVQDLLGAQVGVMFLDLAAGRPHIVSGKIRALGVASPRRIAPLPDVPTIAEQGLPGFEAWAWQGLLAPAGTPKEIVQRIHDEFAKAVANGEVRQKLADSGIEPLSSTPEELTAYIRSESAKWAKVIKEGNIKVE